MAGPMFGPQPVNFFSAMDPGAAQQQMMLQQQQAMAQRMMEEGAQQPDPTRSAPGGWVVPYTAGEGLTHAGKQMAAALMQRNITKQQADLSQRQMQALVSMLRNARAPTANPMSPQAGTPSVMAGSGTEQPQITPDQAPSNDLMSSILPIAAATQLGGPQAGEFVSKSLQPTDFTHMLGEAGFGPEQRQSAYTQHFFPPTNVRPEGTVFQNGKPIFTAPGKGGYIQWTPQGPVTTPIPGASGVTAGQAAATSSGTKYGEQPYVTQVLNTEGAPTLMTGTQILNAATGAPPPLPYGMQQPQQPQQIPQEQPQAPQPAPQQVPQQQAQPQGGGLVGPNSSGPLSDKAIEMLQKIKTDNAAKGDQDGVAAAQHAIEQIQVARGLPTTTQPDQPPSRQLPGLRLQDQGASAQQREFGQRAGELQATAPIARTAVADASNNLLRMKSLASEILNNPALDRVTGLYSKVPNLPGSPAADVQARLDTLKSQVGFAVLQAMRDASKTGGALGQISDRENELLQRNLAAMDQSQSTEGMKRSIQNVINYADGAVERLQRGYRDTYERVVGSQGMQPTARGALPAGQPMYATNGKERIVSHDGGQTWQAAK